MGLESKADCVRICAGKNFAKAFCGDVTVEPGEIVYYPSYWWHQARPACLAPLSAARASPPGRLA